MEAEALGASLLPPFLFETGEETPAWPQASPFLWSPVGGTGDLQRASANGLRSGQAAFGLQEAALFSART